MEASNLGIILQYIPLLIYQVFVSAFGVQHSGPPTTFVNSPLLRLAGQMKKARGLTIASCILEGDPSDYKQETLSNVKSDLQDLLSKEGVVGFVRYDKEP